MLLSTKHHQQVSSVSGLFKDLLHEDPVGGGRKAQNVGQDPEFKGSPEASKPASRMRGVRVLGVSGLGV